MTVVFSPSSSFPLLLQKQLAVSISTTNTVELLSLSLSLSLFSWLPITLAFAVLGAYRTSLPPHFIWHMDSHIKLGNFGIKIYGATDRYSHFVRS
ncbi:hypothetical protein ACN38_g5047 [Penicillium nordicum]|uniref:Uncharacterized protein n=1 Tax=Penicillium nordicum TaxID=229535 RepID=A0A0M9WGR6_9EURO|nr:hypothetical protein ACN38_g5047 [Penicillium nordicum]